MNKNDGLPQVEELVPCHLLAAIVFWRVMKICMRLVCQVHASISRHIQSVVKRGCFVSSARLVERVVRNSIVIVVCTLPCCELEPRNFQLISEKLPTLVVCRKLFEGSEV